MQWIYSEEKIKDNSEIMFDCISFNVTHSHNSTSFYKDFMREANKQVYGEPILPPFELPENFIHGEERQRWLVEKLYDLIIRAWENKNPGGISYAHDYAVVAFNRRPQFLINGELQTIMYGDCSEKNFKRFESGTDNSVELLFTWDNSGKITGVVCNVPCPSQVYELHCFLTADFWAPTRNSIREKLGANVYVLPMCGAAGDLAPVDLIHLSKTNQQALRVWGGQTREVFRDFDMTLLCQSIGDRISEAVVRGYRTARNYIEYNPIFRHEIIDMKIPVRQVSEEDYQEAVIEVQRIQETFSAENPMTMEDLVKAFEPQGVVMRYRQQNTDPDYSPESYFAFGKYAVATNPFELYYEFGQRIKARAEAEQVFIVQLANGCGGYLPTVAAVEGGSYSSKPASTVCGPEGGDLLVEKL